MQQLSDNGHWTLCIVLASQLFEQMDPDVEPVKQILRTVADHSSDGAKYFLMLLNMMVAGEFPMDYVFSEFLDLFERQ